MFQNFLDVKFFSKVARSPPDGKEDASGSPLISSFPENSIITPPSGDGEMKLGRSDIMKNVSEFFGCKVFDDRVMKANLSAKVYQSLRKTIDEGAKLDISVANAVAAAMKDWAVANEATEFFYPVPLRHRNRTL